MTDKLRPKEGWHVLHLYYRIDFGSWHLLSNEEKFAAKTSFSELIQKIRAFPQTQLLTLSMISPKADLGFMLLTEDLHVANSAEKELGLALGPDVLTPAYSFYSLTERSEYTTSEEEFATSLIGEKGLSKDSAEFSQAIEDFRARMKKYLQDRLYPNLPDEQAAKRTAELVCFAICRPEKINGRSRTGWPPVCRTGSPAYHRCNWIRRLGMGRNAVCAGHLRDQIDRLRNAIR
jgi:chlorite dismutase